MYDHCNQILAAFDIAKLVPVLIFFGVIIAYSLIAWVGTATAKKRTQKLQQIAAELSLLFHPVFPVEYDSLFASFPLFKRGNGRRASNAITADSGEIRLVIFDYQYTTGSGKNKSTHRQSVAWVTSRELKLPDFDLYPESWISRIGDMLTKKDIDFADDVEFSKKFVLTGSDPAAVAQFFNLKRRQTLLAMSSPRVEANQFGFIFYRPGNRLAPTEMKNLMSEAFSLYQTFVA